jgi:predicted nucleic acid-binding protein
LIVVDASAVVEVVLRRPKAEVLEARMFRRGETIHAPHFIDLEVAHVVRRHVAAGTASAERAGLALEDLAGLRLDRYPHVPLLGVIWTLRHNFTVYDASYVALADALGAGLLTLDMRLAAAVREHTAVELVDAG